MGQWLARLSIMELGPQWVAPYSLPFFSFHTSTMYSWTEWHRQTCTFLFRVLGFPTLLLSLSILIPSRPNEFQFADTVLTRADSHTQNKHIPNPRQRYMALVRQAFGFQQLKSAGKEGDVKLQGMHVYVCWEGRCKYGVCWNDLMMGICILHDLIPKHKELLIRKKIRTDIV